MEARRGEHDPEGAVPLPESGAGPYGSLFRLSEGYLSALRGGFQKAG